MKRSVFTLLVSLLVLVVACDQTPPYVVLESGLKYRLLDDKGADKPKMGDVIFMDMAHYLGDSLIFQTDEGGFFINPNIGAPPAIREVLNLTGEGDSLQIQMSLGEYASFTGLPISPRMDTTQLVTWNIRVTEIENESTVLERNRVAQAKRDKELIEAFVVNNNLEASTTEEGVYYVSLQEGNGVFPKNGDEVFLKYSMSLLDGTLIDTSSEAIARENDMFNPNRVYGPRSFVLGDREILQGWNIGIPKFSKGGKGRLLIPSYLAYGTSGFGSQIGPNTVIVFDVELVDIK
ncbi:FKBP-type peptidyl-prolyl cis-trans isomerase [Roseivirga sp. E12]|uniref:FKBP-type peptidyl-prolyl cis-trans isomerase n=1 Tax=Roseivirga sp. E12 TaxID=2819237 RepID=UPI001ABD10CE|nr:FKBP-type peptidyl-prolyl cis-trans isomerase [Roseivirga sp. E12]MBO3699385.1 FKBP-type peptidyl-prolyl cis-trans isomerase [Roseivirga sp. E12]